MTFSMTLKPPVIVLVVLLNKLKRANEFCQLLATKRHYEQSIIILREAAHHRPSINNSERIITITKNVAVQNLRVKSKLYDFNIFESKFSNKQHFIFLTKREALQINEQNDFIKCRNLYICKMLINSFKNNFNLILLMVLSLLKQFFTFIAGLSP